MAFTHHPVFPEPNKNQVIWRFMDFVKFYYLLTKKTLFLPSLATLTNDPWEGLPPRIFFDPSRKISVSRLKSNSILDLNNVDNSEIMTFAEYYKDKEKYDSHVRKEKEFLVERKNKTFVSCWHMNETESEALWKIYGGLDYGICIRTTYDKLSRALAYSKPIYAGKVKYLNENTDLLGDNNIFYNCMWKRRSFEHEQEFRVIIYDKEINSPGLLLHVNINCLIEQIIVHPDAKDWFLDVVQEVGKSVGCNNCVKSNLLSSPNYDY